MQLRYSSAYARRNGCTVQTAVFGGVLLWRGPMPDIFSRAWRRGVAVQVDHSSLSRFAPGHHFSHVLAIHTLQKLKYNRVSSAYPKSAVTRYLASSSPHADHDPSGMHPERALPPKNRHRQKTHTSPLSSPKTKGDGVLTWVLKRENTGENLPGQHKMERTGPWPTSHSDTSVPVEIELWATNMQPAKETCSIKMGDSAGWERKTHKSWGNPSAR